MNFSASLSCRGNFQHVFCKPFVGYPAEHTWVEYFYRVDVGKLNFALTDYNLFAVSLERLAM